MTAYTISIKVEAASAEEAVRRVGKSFEDFEKKATFSLGKITAKFETFRRVIQTITNAFRWLRNEFNNFIEGVNRSNTDIKGFHESMRLVKGSAEAASKEFEWLINTSNTLGVDATKVITSYHNIAAAFKDADKTGRLARQTFIGIAEASTVLQMSSEQTKYALLALEQMASKNQVSLEELRKQLGNQLPGTMNIAAAAVMRTTEYMSRGFKDVTEAEAQLMKDIKSGTINARRFLFEFTQELHDRYSDAALELANTFTGARNRLQNVILETKKLLTTTDINRDTALMRGQAQVYGSLADLLERSQPSIIRFGDQIGALHTKVATFLDSLSGQLVDDSITAITRLLNTLTIFSIKLASLVTLDPAVFSAFKVFGQIILTIVMTPLTLLIDILKLIHVGINTLATALVYAGTSLDIFFTDLKSDFLNYKRWVLELSQSMNEPLANAVETIGDYVPVFGEFIKRHAQNSKNNYSISKELAEITEQQTKLDAESAAKKAARLEIINGLLQKNLDIVKSFATPDVLSAIWSDIKPDKSDKGGSIFSLTLEEANALREALGPLYKDVTDIGKLINSAWDRLTKQLNVTELEKAQRKLEDFIKLANSIPDVVYQHFGRDRQQMINQFKDQLYDALHPAESITEEYKKQFEALKNVGDASRILLEQEKIRAILEKKGGSMTEKQINDLATTSIEANRENAAMEQAYKATYGGFLDRRAKFEAMIKTMQHGAQDYDFGQVSLNSSDRYDLMSDYFGKDALSGTRLHLDAAREAYNQYYADLEEMKLRYSDKEKEIDEVIQNSRLNTAMQALSVTGQMFGDLATLAQVSGKKGFKAYKAFAIAEATIAAYQAGVNTYKTVSDMAPFGPYLAPAAAAAAVGAQLARVAQISAMEPPGFKTGGYTGNRGVNDVAGVVHGREFVVNAEATKRHRGLLEDLNSGRNPSSGHSTVVNVFNAPEGTKIEQKTDDSGRLITDIIISDIQSNGPIFNSLASTAGLRRVGR